MTGDIILMRGPQNTREVKLFQSIVLYVDCRGCMAHNHVFKWVGRVIGFEPTRLAGDAAVVEVLKRNESGDFRDCPQGEERIIVADVSLQEIVPGLWCIYK